MFTEQAWKSECLEFYLYKFDVSIPKEVSDAIACLDRDALHRLIELLNLAIWLDRYEEWDSFSSSIVWATTNKFLETQTDNRIWLGLLKVLVGLL